MAMSRHAVLLRGVNVGRGPRVPMALQPLLAAGERLEVGAHAAYLSCPRGLHDSRAAAALLGRAGRGLTTRNWSTTLKLAAMLAA